MCFAFPSTWGEPLARAVESMDGWVSSSGYGDRIGITQFTGIDQVGLRAHHNGYWLSKSLLEFIGIVLALFTLQGSCFQYHLSSLGNIPRPPGCSSTNPLGFLLGEGADVTVPGTCGIAKMGPLSFFLCWGRGVGGYRISQ